MSTRLPPAEAGPALRKTVAYDKEARAWAVRIRLEGGHVDVQLGGYATPEDASGAGDGLIAVALLCLCAGRERA